jgi:hypothetical protein
MKPNVSIIVLNWNGWNDTIECLESLYQINYPNYNVIVVDNGSEDESIKKIKDYCNGEIEVKSDFFEYYSNNKPIKILEVDNKESEDKIILKSEFLDLPSNNKLILIKNDKNYGFAEGNNIGIRFTLNQHETDYVLLLNNDTVVHENFLEKMVKKGENARLNGIIGPKIYFYDNKNIIQATSIKINLKKGTTKINGLKEVDQGQYDNETKSNSVPGSCILIKREVIDKVGLLNKDYFCYWEENEFCMRAVKAGYMCIYTPEPNIWHKGSQSSNKITGFTTYYLTRNTFWFEKTYAKLPEYCYFILYFLFIRFWQQTFIYLIIQKNNEVFISFLKGILDGLKN